MTEVEGAVVVIAYTVVMSAALVGGLWALGTMKPEDHPWLTRVVGALFDSIARGLLMLKRKLIDLAWRIMRRLETRKAKR